MEKLVCPECGRTYDASILDYCCECGSVLDLDCEMETFNEEGIDKRDFTMFRYRRFMPIKNDLYKKVSLGEGLTPTVELKKDLFVKVDYEMPTLSFKDRGAAVVVWHALSIGAKKLVQDSSGNAGNSIAAYAARAGMHCTVFVPKGTSESKLKMISSHGAELVVYDGSRDETADACRKFARESGAYYANHVYCPYFYHGTKTFVYEIYEQLGKIPDNIFIPTGNGTLEIGCEIGIRDLLKAGLIEKAPKIFIVQSEKCAPLYNAVDDFLPIKPEPTLAEGIAIGKPMRAKEILKSDYPGEREIILVPESGIMPAREELAREGYFVEHTTAATYAAYKKYAAERGIMGTSIIPLCGAGLKSEH